MTATEQIDDVAGDGQGRPSVVLTIPAKAENLVFCRLALVGIGRTHRIDPETLADLKLAVTEACSNAILHAYEEGAGEVSVRFTLHPQAIEVEVEDRGVGTSPPAEPAPPDPSEYAEAGMGLAIIRALSDEFELRTGRDGQGTLVRFTRSLA